MTGVYLCLSQSLGLNVFYSPHFKPYYHKTSRWLTEYWILYIFSDADIIISCLFSVIPAPGVTQAEIQARIATITANGVLATALNAAVPSLGGVTTPTVPVGAYTKDSEILIKQYPSSVFWNVSLLTFFHILNICFSPFSFTISLCLLTHSDGYDTNIKSYQLTCEREQGAIWIFGILGLLGHPMWCLCCILYEMFFLRQIQGWHNLRSLNESKWI